MAWTETFHCDVCNKQKKEDSEDWWLVWDDPVTPTAGDSAEPAIRIMLWNNFVSHSTEMRHLCGAVCLHTMLDRWMSQRCCPHPGAGAAK